MSLAIPIISGAVSLFSGIANSIAAGNAAKKAEADLKDRRDKAERQYLHEYNTDYLDTASAKSTLAQLRRQKEKQMEALQNDAVKQGTSEEGKVAMAGRLNDSYADATSRLAGFGTQYQQQIKDNYLRRLDTLDNALYNSQLGKADALSGVSASIGAAANSAMEAYGQGAFSKSIGAPSSSRVGFSTKPLPDLSSVVAVAPTPQTKITIPQYR